MIKKILFGLFLFSAVTSSAQDLSKFNLYKPADNAKAEIEKSVKLAKETGKHVLIQIGGNWCIWCARFNDLVTKDAQLDSAVKTNYIVYHLNYSKENKNLEVLKKYKFPQRFGFPVFLILNEKGELLHTQSSWYLEAGKGYDKEKTMAFLNDWNKKSLDPENYKEE
jgi:thioredoxin-related protein